MVIQARVPGTTLERVDRARRMARGWKVLQEGGQDGLEDHAQDIEVVFGGIPERLVRKARGLRWVQLTSAGAEHALTLYPDPGIALTTASGVHAIPVTEHVLGMMLCFARGLHHALRAQVRGAWEPQRNRALAELSGACLVVLGLGAIGTELSRAASALGMDVVGVRRDPSRPAPPGVRRVVGPQSLNEVLGLADFVVITAPHTTGTHAMFGKAEFERMKPTSYLINIGRGRTVRETDLVRALEHGRIAGAGLDVFEDEPLPTTSPLWRMENVILTAHYAGHTPRYGDRLWRIFLDNLGRYLRGEPLINTVDRTLGY
jgi:phosphoglycerate dehydrogenase-like enzyme